MLSFASQGRPVFSLPKIPFLLILFSFSLISFAGPGLFVLQLWF